MNYGEQRELQVLDQKGQRQKVRRYLSNSNALASVMSDIADGTKVSDIAKRLNVSYSALYGALTSTYKEDYRAARAAFAELLAEKNLDMADRVEALQLPQDAAKTAASLRQWHMERTAGEQWGQKSSVDVTHRGIVGLHLDAIRQLTNEPIEGDYVEVEDGLDDVDDDGGGAGSVADVSPPGLKEPSDESDDGGSDTADDLENHPLL